MSPTPLVSELLVTATKRVEIASRLPASISAVSADELSMTGVTDATGVVRLTAGMTITNLGAGRDKIMLRGLSDGAFTGRTRSTVGTFLDDTPITYNAPDPDLRLTDVASIEVVRGPQGALYGAGSISGVYRIVTRKPELDQLQASLRGLAAWTQSGSPSQQVDAMVNLPLVDGRAALRVVGYYDLEGGYLDDVNLRLSNVDQTTRQGGRAALKTRLAGDWTLTLSTAVQQLDSKDTQYVTGTSGLRRANRVRESHNNDFSQAVIALEGPTPWGGLKSSTAYVRHAFSSKYDASAALSLFDDPIADLGIYEERTHIGMLVQDTVLTSERDGPFKWLVGLYGVSSREDSPSQLKVNATGKTFRNVYDDVRTDRLGEVALYGEMSLAFGQGWTVALGGRESETRLNTTSHVTVTGGGTSRAFNRKAVFDNWSPKLSLQYVFENGVMIYGLASQGYRAGGFNSGGLSTPTAARRTFRPDHLRNLEIGAKASLLDDRLDLKSTVFYELWRDIQTDQFFASGLPYTANVGDGRNVGLELEATWRPSANWSFQTNLLLDQPKITRVDPAFASRVQSHLPGVPDTSFGALVAYSRPLRPGLTLILTGQTAYVGRSRLTFDPALSPEMGGYFTGRLSAQVKADRWRLAAFVENPGNTQGDTFAYGNPFSFGQVRQVTPQRPRTISLVLTRDF
ncbi:TonB-dependent receptor [Phenylobacterium aquaticum]|uniref:TonB-dependent receptor n=1 Tax=Phenylobacterium aquaticum TaxID=1763816 RepID=UPI0026EAC40A|nr:TonB-dependent receptor [Phenylobacterium aquaticum]